MWLLEIRVDDRVGTDLIHKCIIFQQQVTETLILSTLFTVGVAGLVKAVFLLHSFVAGVLDWQAHIACSDANLQGI